MLKPAHAERRAIAHEHPLVVRAAVTDDVAHPPEPMRRDVGRAVSMAVSARRNPLCRTSLTLPFPPPSCPPRDSRDRHRPRCRAPCRRVRHCRREKHGVHRGRRAARVKPTGPSGCRSPVIRSTAGSSGASTTTVTRSSGAVALRRMRTADVGTRTHRLGRTSPVPPRRTRERPRTHRRSVRIHIVVPSDAWPGPSGDRCACCCHEGSRCQCDLGQVGAGSEHAVDDEPATRPGRTPRAGGRAARSRRARPRRNRRPPRFRHSSAVACAVERHWNGPAGIDCERPSIVSVL